MNNNPLILQVTGYKKSGKTTLITSLIKHLKEEYQWNVATIKHDAHGFQLDQEDTDTYKHREAGAMLSIIQSANGLGLTLHQEQEKSLEQLIELTAFLQPCQMILIEGFKREKWPKLLLLGQSSDFELIRQLTQIEALVFPSKELIQSYKQNVALNQYPLYPAFTLDDQPSLLDWLADFIHNGKKTLSRKESNFGEEI